MRRRIFPAPPPPVESDSAQAAKAIANAINQGLPGGQFCRLVNVMNTGDVKAAAEMSLEKLIQWFQQDATATRILQACPTFNKFAEDFHAEARLLHPPKEAPPVP